MKRFIVLAAIGSLLAPTLAAAGGRDGRGWGPPPHAASHYRGGYRHPAPYYPAYRYPAYHHHHRGSDSDDAAWAIGGLVVGALIGTAAARAEQREASTAASSTPLPPPQKRKVVTCYDEVAYDQAGEPYVARQCYENWR